MLNNYDLSEIFSPGKRLLFAGVGGVSMSALCLLCHEKGMLVSGYDLTQSQITDSLTAKGIPVAYAFDKALYHSLDAVIFTAAIHDTDPIIAYPESIGIPLIPRSEALGYLSLEKRNRIGIAGTHGKSTTTGMLAKIFLAADRDPMILAGARLSELDGTLRLGNGDDLIFEACEYQDSFLHFSPTISVILDVEHDHVDYFPTEQAISDSFARYANIPGKDGFAVIDFDTPLARDVSKRVEIPMITVSTQEKADFSAQNIRSEKGLASFSVEYRGNPYLEIKLGVPGLFQVSNALCAIAVSHLCGIPKDKIQKALLDFQGVERRFQMRGTLGGIPLIDDYAHHPSEIAATLSAANECGYRDIVCVFQSHTFTRTKAFWNDFVNVFASCRKVIFADIYPAREEPIPGIDAQHLANACPNGVYLGDMDAIASNLKNTSDADLFLIMGAGDIIKLSDRIFPPEGA